MTYFKQNNSFIRLEPTNKGFAKTEVQCFEDENFKAYFIENKCLTKDKVIDTLCGCLPSSQDEFNKALSEAKEWIAQL